MSKLESYYYYEDRIFTPSTHCYRLYHADEADKVIAEKDKEIAELKKQVHDYAQGLYVMQARAEKDARQTSTSGAWRWLKDASLECITCPPLSITSRLNLFRVQPQ